MNLGNLNNQYEYAKSVLNRKKKEEEEEKERVRREQIKIEEEAIAQSFKNIVPKALSLGMKE